MRLIKEVREGIKALPKTRKEIQKFAAVISAVLIALAALIFYLKRDPITTLWITGFTIALILAAILVPHYLRFLYIFWMGLAFLLGGIVSRIILTLFYYLILTPIGWLLRALGKNPVPRDFKTSAASYWVTKKNPLPEQQTYRRPF